MSKDTNIHWCDGSVNPVMGCSGCELWSTTRKTCYAGILHQRYGGQKGYAPTFEEVTMFPGRMAAAAKWGALQGLERNNKPWLNGLPRTIFISDMSDSLSAPVTFEYLKAEIIDIVTTPHGQRHFWLWLTKRPSRMWKFSDWLLDEHGVSWPENLMPITSVTDQKTANSRIPELMRVGNEKTLRGLSAEPLFGPVRMDQDWKLDWIITGGESGDGAEIKPFDIWWAFDLKHKCARDNTPFFMKQLGSNPYSGKTKLVLNDSKGGDWSEWPEELQVRQMPRMPILSPDLPEKEAMLL